MPFVGRCPLRIQHQRHNADDANEHENIGRQGFGKESIREENGISHRLHKQQEKDGAQGIEKEQ